MTAHDTPPEELRERPIGDLVKQLANQTSSLVCQELDLAKAEMAHKASVAGKGAGLLGGAAVVGLLAAGALTACLILVLSKAMDAWLAALIVTLGFVPSPRSSASPDATRFVRRPHPYPSRPSKP